MNKPRQLDPLADRVLSLLSGRPEAAEIVLGGYLALQHHIDDAGRQNVLLHLAEIEARRPLDSIADPVQRERARHVRGWFRDAFAGR